MAAGGGSGGEPSELATGGADPAGGAISSGGQASVGGTSGSGGSSAKVSLKVMSYNVYGWNALTANPWKGENIVEQVKDHLPDLLGLQEAENKAGDIASDLGAGYAVAGSPSHGVALLYRSDVLTLNEAASGNLVEQDQWGQRVYHFAHYTIKETGQGFYHFNSHFCVCSKDQLLGSAQTIVGAISSRTHGEDPVVLTGDFNVFDGFENSLAIQYFKGGIESPLSLSDSFRAIHPDADGSTFGAAGKIDYVLLSPSLSVQDADIDRSMPGGEGSDHYPIWATFEI